MAQEWLHDLDAVMLAEAHIQARGAQPMDKCECETRRGICPVCTAWYAYTVYCPDHVPQGMELGQPTATECRECEANRGAPEEIAAPPSEFIPW